ncbi:unnamed protein product, partial [Polarella glacialis]
LSRPLRPCYPRLVVSAAAASEKLPSSRPGASSQPPPCPELALLLALGPSPTAVQVSSVLEKHLASWQRNPRAGTVVLSGLAKNRLPEVSVHVLGFMQARQVEVNVFHCGAAISACDKAHKWQLALDLLQLMSDIRVAGDKMSCNAAISACAKAGRWQLALGLLSQLPEMNIVLS